MTENNIKDVYSGIVLDETTIFTIEEICKHCQISESIIIEMMEYGLVEPRQTQETVLFDLTALRRIKSASRLQHDFEINLQGVALVLELLDELEKTRHELNLLRKQL